MASLILCADDFALSRGTSVEIADLAAAGKINAVSCISASICWDQTCHLLQPLQSEVAIGLHLVLTDEPALVAVKNRVLLNPLTIDALTFQSITGRLPVVAIARAVENQFNAFSMALGRPPAFVDGHQHSHLLPGIREIVMRRTLSHAPRAWLRNCFDHPAALLDRRFSGKAFASAAWSIGMKEKARQFGLSTNDSFAGHYDFKSDFRALFPTFLRSPGHSHLVMCHPGAADGIGDTIGGAREREAAALRALAVRELAAQAALEF